MEIFKPKEPGPETRRSAERAGEGDRRRGGWRDFRRAYPGFVFVLGLGLVTMIAVDGWLFVKRVKYNHDVAQLRAHMTQAERERTDASARTRTAGLGRRSARGPGQDLWAGARRTFCGAWSTQRAAR